MRISIGSGSVGVGSVLSFLVCVLGVLVVVVVPASKFAVFDRVFTSIYPMVFVMYLSDVRPLRSFAKAAGPWWCFAAFVDAVLVSGDDGFAHGDRETRALCANVERLRAWIRNNSGDACIAAHLSGCFTGDVLPVFQAGWAVGSSYKSCQINNHRNVGL